MPPDGPVPPDEPATPEAVAAWIANATTDPFAHVRVACDEHRAAHGCNVYPTSSGPVLAVLARARGARVCLEVGGGLGYSALWLAYGAGTDARVATVERDPEHARLARETLEREGYAHRVEILEGEAATVLDELTDPVDLLFFDADPSDALGVLPHAFRLLDPGGVLVSANLFLGVYDPTMPGLDQTAGYRERLLEDDRLLTAFLPGGLAVSVRVR